MRTAGRAVRAESSALSRGAEGKPPMPERRLEHLVCTARRLALEALEESRTHLAMRVLEPLLSVDGRPCVRRGKVAAKRRMRPGSLAGSRPGTTGSLAPVGLQLMSVSTSY